MIDRISEHHQIYRPTFNFSPTRNRPVFLIRWVNRSVVGPLLKSVQNCCKGDSHCHWNAAIFRPPGIENPWTNRHQTWSGWLRRDLTPHANVGVSTLKGGACTYRWNCIHRCLFLPPFPVTFLLTCALAHVAPFDQFLCFMAQKSLFREIYVLFGCEPKN